MRLYAFLAGSMLLAAVSTEVRAQTASELVAARALFTEGVELEKKKDYGGALEKFRKVASIKSTAIVRYHEGFCAEKLGHWIEALDAYAKAVIDGQGDPKQKDAVDAAKKAENALRPRVPKIHTKVTGSQKGKYEIRIDGTPVSAALIDTAVPVDVGKHVVELSGDNIISDSQEVTVAEKETRDVVFAAQEPGANPPPKKDDVKPPPKKDDVKPPPPPPPQNADVIKPPPEPPKKEAPRLAIVFGFGIGNIQPGGRLVDENSGFDAFTTRRVDGEPVKSSEQYDYVGPGLAIEPLIGFRFLQPFAIYGFFQRGFLKGSGFFKDDDITASTSAFGLGAMLNTHPNSMFGGYVDVAISTRSLSYVNRSTEETATLFGADLRLKLGLAYKPMPTLTLLGFGFVSAGTYSTFSYEATSRPADVFNNAPIDKAATHTWVGLGVGGLYDLSLR